MLLHELIQDITNQWAAGVLGLCLGALVAWLFARWKRHRQRQNILLGDARDTVVVEQHIVETAARPGGGKSPAALRMRSLGQAQIEDVIPNDYLASEFRRRATEVTPRHTLLSMEGADGSYLLEALTNFVCDRVSGAPFEHDLYVMAPCCEPAGLAVHQPVVILLIAAADLALFEDWADCRSVRVEHGSDGARVLTLMELARRFRAEREKIEALRRAGERTMHLETVYLLDLALDRRAAPVPVREIPWGRFEAVLKQMNLE